MSRVSVIITTYSRPDRLPNAVQSAIDAGSDVEVIVVDDASTDTTAETCGKLQGIRYIRLEKNQGTAGARNVGIEASTGDYISFHDDDDKKIPGSLDEMAAVLDANPHAGLAYGKAWGGNDDLEPIGDPFPKNVIEGDVFWRLIEANFIPTITAVFRKSCLSEIGMVDTTIPGVDDYDLWIRIAEKYQVVALEKPVGIWRTSSLNSGQGSSDRVREIIRANTVSNRALDTLPRALKDIRNAERARAAINNRTSDFLYWSASESYKHGRISEMRKSLFAALKFDAKRLVRPTVLRMFFRALLPN